MPSLTKSARRNAFETVDKVGERHLWRVLNEEMDMVWLAGSLHKHGLEIVADLVEGGTSCLPDTLGEDGATVLRHEDQMS